MSHSATTTKTSISVQNKYWAKLKTSKNRSYIINEALDLYFEREQYLSEAKKKYWENIDKHLQNNTGEYVVLNEANKDVTPKLLEEKLWN